MNQTQVNNFLMCLLQIDDLNYLALHERAHASMNGSFSQEHRSENLRQDEPDHDHHYDHDHDHTHDHHHDHDHDSDSELSSSHDLLVAKVTAMCVLFVATTVCGSIPFVLDRCFKWTDKSTSPRSANVVKCLLYFGGGVLLCTTFLHLLPEVQEIVGQLQECRVLPKLTFPLAELLMCAGFFLMYLIEESIHAYIHRHQRLLLEKDAGAGAAFERGRSVRNSYLVKGAASRKRTDGAGASETLQSAECSLQPTAPAAALSANSELSLPGSDIVTTLSIQNLISKDLENHKYQDQNAYQLEQHNHYDHKHNHNDLQKHSHNHGHGHSHSHIPSSGSSDELITSSLRGLFIVLALSLHELFEGMAIGLEGSANAVWFMFGAVSAHKLVLAFCVGVELIVARTRRNLSIVYVFTFAIVSPIGIGVGILISHNNSTTAPSIPSAILQGIACGTLLYVVFFEILSKNQSGLMAYLALFVGFAIMFGLQQLGADKGHSHGGCPGPMDDHTKSLIFSQHDLNQQEHPTHQHSHHHADAAHSSSHDHRPQDFEEQLQLLRLATQKLIQSDKKLQ